MSRSSLHELAHKFLTLLSDYRKIGAQCAHLEAAAVSWARGRDATISSTYYAELERAERESGLLEYEEQLGHLIRELDLLAIEMTKHQPRTLEEIGALAVLTAWAEYPPPSDSLPAWQIKWQNDLKESILRLADSKNKVIGGAAVFNPKQGPTP